MADWLIILGIPVGYVVIGRWYANRTLPWIIQDARSQFRYEHVAMDWARFNYAYHWAFWPVFMAVHASRTARDRNWQKAVDAANGDPR